jgi:hypothetical protein
VTRGLLLAACILTLVALALMMWSLFVPTVWPIMVAMSVAQGFGTIAFAIYGYVVFRDMRRRMVNKPKTDFLGITKELQDLDPISRPSQQAIEVAKEEKAS